MVYADARCGGLRLVRGGATDLILNLSVTSEREQSRRPARRDGVLKLVFFYKRTAEEDVLKHVFIHGPRELGTIMDRETVEGLKINSLRHLASRLSLNTKGGRQTLADRVIDYYQSVSWVTNIPLLERAVEDSRIEEGMDSRSRDIINPQGAVGGVGTPSGEGQSDGSDAELTSRVGSNNNTRPNSTMERATEVMNVQTIDLQEIVRAVVQVMEQRQQPRGEAAGDSSDGPIGATGDANSWHQIKFAMKLIPEFAGHEDENVVK